MKNYPIGLLTNDTNTLARLESSPLSGLNLSTSREVATPQEELLACHKLDLTVDTELLPLSTAVEYLVDLFGEQEGDNYLILNDQKISLRDKNALKDQVKKIEQ